MNPLTQIKNTQKATASEIRLGLSDSASWHSKFKHSAYVFTGGLDYGLTEGDLLAVFAQYGEIVDVHLVRDKSTGKSRGFAFLAYEDQRSTVLAVDNLSGAKVAGRTIRVEHVDNYRRKKAEIEGEDPEALPPEEQQMAAQGDRLGPGEARAVSQEPPPMADDGFAAGGSIAALLAEGARLRREQEAKKAATGSGEKKKKEKKAKKEKKRKREHKSGARSDSDVSSGGEGDVRDKRSPPHGQTSFGPPRPGNGSSFGPPKPANGSSAHTAAFGPPRVPPRDHNARNDSRSEHKIREGLHDDSRQSRREDTERSQHDGSSEQGKDGRRYDRDESRHRHDDRDRWDHDRRLHKDREDIKRSRDHDVHSHRDTRYSRDTSRSPHYRRDDRDRDRDYARDRDKDRYDR